MRTKEDAARTFDTYYSILKDCEESVVIQNLNNHIKSSIYPPTINNLVAKQKSEHYIPSREETLLRLAAADNERVLAISTRGVNVKPEEIQAEKEKALRAIAEAVERSKVKNDEWDVLS